MYNDRSELVAGYNTATDPQDYEGTVQFIADTIESLTPRQRKIAAASIAVAAEVEDGVLTRSGGLTPWVGRELAADLALAMDLSYSLVNTPNDVVAIAISQQAINLRNKRPAKGIATTLSSGWGGAFYLEKDLTFSDEPGHEYLRPGGIYPCGREGHAEAFISGGGIKTNHGLSMVDWLASDPEAPQLLVTDISAATIAMVERHKARGLTPKEIRWTGGVALGQPFIMQRVAADVIGHFGSKKMDLAFDTVTMAEQAGLHGTFIDAERLANRY